MMRTRADYEHALVVVRRVIDEWDPYGLLADGAPADEWDREIVLVVARIPRIASEEDAAHAISRVFSEAFQARGFTPEDCADVGRRLYQTLVAEGVLK